MFRLTRGGPCAHDPLQAAGEGRATAEQEDDNCSSYGSMESEEEEQGFLHIQPDRGTDALYDMLDNMKCSIAGIDAKQNEIVEKIASLEKVVFSMQVDMTWVREDLGVVHEVMEKLTDHVCTLSKTRSEANGVPDQRSPEVSPWGTWKQDAQFNEREEAGIIANTEEAVVHLGDEEPNHIRGGTQAACSIRETQMHDMYSRMHATIASSVDDGGGGGVV